MKDNQFVEEDDDRPDARVWDVVEVDRDGFPVVGPLLVTFDKCRVYNLWTEYP